MVQDTVQGVKDKLEKIVDDMKKEGNPHAAGVESVVTKFITETLDKIIGGAKTASEAIGDASDLIGNVAAGGAGAAAGAGGDVVNLVKGIRNIVDVVLKGVGRADAGDDKKAEDGSTARTSADSGAGKLFANDSAGANANDAKKVAADAAKAVGAVIGADILQAMVKEGGAAAKLAVNNTANNAVADAANAKDATIAGGIALRAMAKNGKFAHASDNANVDAKKAVEGAAISAVTKALDTLTIAIRKTIDTGLKTVKGSIKINPEGTSVTTEITPDINK